MSDRDSSSSDGVALSASALAALRDFALDRGIDVQADGSDALDNVRKACDVQDKEDTWEYEFGDLHLSLTGLYNLSYIQLSL